MTMKEPVTEVGSARGPARSAWSGTTERTGVRFILVGIANTIFGFSVFVALEMALGHWLHYLVVLLVAHVVGVLCAFLLYRRFVYRVEGPFLPDLMRFGSVYVGTFVVNLVALPLAVDGLGLPVIIAQGLVLVATAACGFVLHGRWTFRRPGPVAPPS